MTKNKYFGHLIWKCICARSYHKIYAYFGLLKLKFASSNCLIFWAKLGLSGRPKNMIASAQNSRSNLPQNPCILWTSKTEIRPCRFLKQWATKIPSSQSSSRVPDLSARSLLRCQENLGRLDFKTDQWLSCAENTFKQQEKHRCRDLLHK